MSTADRILAGLVPPHELPSADHGEPLPLAAMLIPTLSDGSLTYAVSRVDESGVVAATHVLERLGWRTGDRLAVTTVRNVIVMRRNRDGVQAVPKRRLLVIPAAARRACGIRTGDSLLLAAAVEVDTILIHPPAVLDQMMTLYHHKVPGDD